MKTAPAELQLDEDLLSRDTQIAVERMTSFLALLLVVFLILRGARKQKLKAEQPPTTPVSANGQT